MAFMKRRMLMGDTMRQAHKKAMAKNWQVMATRNYRQEYDRYQGTSRTKRNVEPLVIKHAV
jgi:hypothetical protein